MYLCHFVFPKKKKKQGVRTIVSLSGARCFYIGTRVVNAFSLYISEHLKVLGKEEGDCKSETVSHK